MEFLAKCLNCQQVKYKYHSLGGLAQRNPIPILQWERITIDFVVGLPQNFVKFESIWVIINRFGKSDYSMPGKVSYSAKKLVKL